jgi:tetratricopeptide (TPR) repeat protein
MGLFQLLFGKRAPQIDPAEAQKQANEMVRQAIDILRENRSHNDVSISLLKKALELWPRQALALKELGIACQSRRAFGEAAEYLRRCANCSTEKYDCDSPEDFRVAILDRAGTCYQEMGKHADAVEVWEYVLHKANTAPDVRWSTNAKYKLQQDIAAAKARLQGKTVMRTYGQKGQGAAGIDRVLNLDENRALEAAVLRDAPRSEMIKLVQSWRFEENEAANLVDDAVAFVTKLRKMFS